LERDVIGGSGCLLAAQATAADMIALILQMEEGLQLKIVLLLWLWWNERNAVRKGKGEEQWLTWCT
jgi:hypothetical protein